MSKLIFAFDVGKGSLGEAVRKDNDIVEANSFLIPADFASTKDQATRRRQWRTRIAHSAREDWLKKICKEAGIEVLNGITCPNPKKNIQFVPADPRLEREFPKKGDNTVYTSCLLRIMLLEGQKPEGWQIYKALHSAMQRRGYDPDVAWKSGVSKEDDEASSKDLNEFDKKLNEIKNLKEEHKFCCYYDAYKMGLWSPQEGIKSIRQDFNAERARGYTPSRKMVEEEIRLLVKQAAKLFPFLAEKEEYVLYGPAEKAYASYDPEIRKKHHLKRGAETDWQGLLGQKIPRFDNRVLNKCCLIPRLNVCRSSDGLNIQVQFLMKLMNMRFDDDFLQRQLNYDEIKELFNLSTEKAKQESQKENKKSKAEKCAHAFKLTKSEWKKWLHAKGFGVYENSSIVEPANISGRSRFSRPALKIMKELILSGQSPHDFYKNILPEVENAEWKGVFPADLDFLKKMPNDWKKIHIPSISLVENYSDGFSKEEGVRKIIAEQTDPIIRHRLNFFNDRMDTLVKQYGQPDKIIMEFVRDDFLGEEAKKKLYKHQNERQKEHERIKQTVEEHGLSGKSIKLKYELMEQQSSQCIYTGDPIGITDLDSCEIDHIVPQKGKYYGPDAIYNKVLTFRKTNEEKGAQIPYEFLYNSDQWNSYQERVKKLSVKLGKKKTNLLISPDAGDEVEKYTGLAETAWIAKSARDIICLKFGWQPGEKGEEQKVITVPGALTAKIRRKYHLDWILAPEGTTKDDISKNRGDHRHHALDAMVISYLPQWMNDKKKRKFFNLPDGVHKDYFAEKIEDVVPQKVAFMKKKLEESHFSNVGGKAVMRYDVFTYLGEDPDKALKSVKNIVDQTIQQTLTRFLNTEPTQEEWLRFLGKLRVNGNTGPKVTYITATPKKGSVSIDTGYFESTKTPGQYFKTRVGQQYSYPGIFIYTNEKGKGKVRPVHAYESISAVENEILKQGFDIKMFFQSGCTTEILSDIKNDDGEVKIAKGQFVVNTVTSKGEVKIQVQSDEIRTNVNSLLKAGWRRVEF